MIRDARSTKTAAEFSRKEMKGPDRFQVAATAAAEWMHQKRRALLIALGVGVAVLLAAVGGDAYLRSRRDAAGGALYQALAAVDGEISTVPLPGVDRPVFKTEEERQRAVIAAAGEARRRHAGTPAAATAALAAGDAHLRLREWDLAGAAFAEYLSTAARDDALRFAALDGQARVAEGKGDLEGAARAFEQAGQEAPFYKDRAVLEQARVLQRAGKAAEARKRLEAFPAEFKESPLKAEAQERLARLGGS